MSRKKGILNGPQDLGKDRSRLLPSQRPRHLDFADELQPIVLPKPEKERRQVGDGGMWERKTNREIKEDRLPPQALSNLLWAAFGVNREAGPMGLPGRTAASASNSQEIDIYVALPEGVFIYKAAAHRLTPVAAGDLREGGEARSRAGRRGEGARCSIVFVVDIAKYAKARFQEPGLKDPDIQKSYYDVATGLIAGNVYLFAASQGLAAWFHNCDKPGLAEALKLRLRAAGAVRPNGGLSGKGVSLWLCSLQDEPCDNRRPPVGQRRNSMKTKRLAVWTWFLAVTTTGAWFVLMAEPALAADGARFTRLTQLPAPKIIASAKAFNESYCAENVLLPFKPGKHHPDYASLGLGEKTFIDFDFGRPVRVAAFRHIQRRTIDTIAEANLMFSDAADFNHILATVKVRHVDEPGATTFAAFAPVTARYVRWQVTSVLPGRSRNVGGQSIEFLRPASRKRRRAASASRRGLVQIIERKDGTAGAAAEGDAGLSLRRAVAGDVSASRARSRGRWN